MIWLNAKKLKKDFETKVLDHKSLYNITKINMEFYKKDVIELKTKSNEFTKFYSEVVKMYEKVIKAKNIENNLIERKKHPVLKDSLNNYFTDNKFLLLSKIYSFMPDSKMNIITEKHKKLVSSREYFAIENERLKNSSESILKMKEELSKKHKLKDFCEMTIMYQGKSEFFDLEKEIGGEIDYNQATLFENSKKLNKIFDSIKKHVRKNEDLPSFKEIDMTK